MAKVRVHELAKEFGVESKVILATLKDMGEFVKSASSTIEAPVVRRLNEDELHAVGDDAGPPLIADRGTPPVAPRPRRRVFTAAALVGDYSLWGFLSNEGQNIGGDFLVLSSVAGIAAAPFVGGVAVHLVILDERLARGGHLPHPLKAYTGPTVIDHEVVVHPETLQMVDGILAELVAPYAVALGVVNVGVLDLDLVTRLQARADKAQGV